MQNFFFILSTHKLFVFGLWIALNINFIILSEGNSLDLCAPLLVPKYITQNALTLVASIK
jgi:hypothetical protein